MGHSWHRCIETLCKKAFQGGVSGVGWSLSQQGNTFGDYTGTELLGVWTLKADDITRLVINALIAGFAFDNLEGAIGTPGSDVGRPFVSGSSPGFGPVATYSDLFSAPDLYGTLSLDWGSTAFTGEMSFMADTDKVPVPAPPGVLLLASGLLAIAGINLRTRKQKDQIKNKVVGNV